MIYATIGRYLKIVRNLLKILCGVYYKNLIGQLTILNLIRLWMILGEVITRLEILEETNYPIDLKMLYIHMCVMVG